MSMSQQDYVLIARVLNDCLAVCRNDPSRFDTPEDGVWMTIFGLADAMSRQRPQFDRSKFMKAVDKTRSAEN
jgi:hypothetical protein